jgi:hypothetical protein
MKKMMILGALAVSVVLYSCKDDAERIEDSPIVGQTIELTYDFETGTEGWEAGLAGFPADDEDLYDLEVEHTTLPDPLDDEGALMVKAANPNDNLILFISKEVTGLEPNTRYDVNFSIEFASVVEIDTTGFVVDDTTGIGADTTGFVSDTVNVGTDIYANNDTVIIKAGAVPAEPVLELDNTNYFQFAGIDLGEVGEDGSDLIVLGSVSGDTTDGLTLQTVSNESPISVSTNGDGELWLIVASESFGSSTVIYYNNITVQIGR